MKQCKMDRYVEELAGLVALPDILPCSLLEHATHIAACIRAEQAKPLPDNTLITTLCDAARLGYEYAGMEG